jgi:RNA polymerase sigma factor for flagellar operon FliA
MPLVYQAVAHFMRRLPPNVLREDLVAAGTYGLMDSLRRSPIREGTAHECYMRIRIRGAILDELRMQDWLPRRTRWIANGKATAAARGAVPSVIVGFDDLSGSEIGATLADELAVGPDEALERESVREALSRAVDLLPERERFIVRLHYHGGAKFKDIGVRLGVSEPRISQLHARALCRLRQMLQEEREAA